jgi:hypothetical protein
MGSITRSFANNIGSSGILTASAVTNTTIEDVTSFDNAASAGTLVLLSTQTASASATISFTTGLDSTYDEYIFKFINIHPETNGAEFQFQGDTGTNTNYNQTITSTSFQTNHKEDGSETGLFYAAPFDQAQGTGFQTIQANVYNDNDNGASGTLQIFNPSSTTFVKHFISDIQSQQLDGVGMSQRYFTAGYFNLTTALTRFQFKFSSGNIDDGIIKLYGVKKS